MSKFDDISDELFSSYLESNCSDAEIEQVEDAISTVDDLNTLLLSKSVMNMMEEETNDLPGFEKAKVIKFEPRVNLRATGFLGNQDTTASLPPENVTIADDEKQDK